MIWLTSMSNLVLKFDADVGMLLASGLPRQAAAVTEMGGVRMNFSCPDVKRWHILLMRISFHIEPHVIVLVLGAGPEFAFEKMISRPRSSLLVLIL